MNVRLGPAPRGAGFSFTTWGFSGTLSPIRAAGGVLLGSVSIVLSLVGGSGEATARESDIERAAATTIRPEALRAHMEFLADDLLEGRGTGTRGYALAAAYVAAQFEAIGLKPGGDSASYFQKVPLRRARLVEGSPRFTLRTGRKSRTLEYGKDYLFAPDAVREVSSVEAPLVYVGFGVSAPEFGYDDLAGVDLEGKIAVVLRGAPASFPHNERAFYSRSSQKMETLVRRGAVGVLNFRLRSPRSPSSPGAWEKGVMLSKIPSLEWVEEDGTPHGVFPEILVSGTLSRRGMEAIFEGAPVPLAEALHVAEESQPHGFDLRGRARLERRSHHEATESPNVLGVLEGSDPALRSEFLIYTAHLDHLGMGASLDGDRIYNGAYDNASGTAMLIETARVFASLPKAPRRSILFAAVTGEERGLLGSEYFSEHPTVPGGSIVADVNLDMVLLLEPLHDVVAFGAEHSSLGPIVEKAAREVGFAIVEDPEPEEVIFIRSDQFSFVKKGIPSVFLVPSLTRSVDEAWMRDIYHSQNDEMGQPMDWESGVRFTIMNVLVGWDVAQSRERPRWNPEDFFGKRFHDSAPAGQRPR